MEWMIPWTKLDEMQRHAVTSIENSKDHCIWVDGFAGSGKTLILLHLIKRALTRGESVCFITFTKALTMLVSTGFTNEELRKIRVINLNIFMKEHNKYDFIVFDEVQDARLDEIIEASQRAIRRLVIAGDPNQSIYNNRVSKDELLAYIEIKRPILLKKVYRLTEKIKKVATCIFPKSNIISAERPVENNVLKRGSDVYLFEAQSIDDEIQFVMSKAIEESTPGTPCAILFLAHYAIREFCIGYAKQQKINFDVPINEGIMDYQSFNKFSLNHNWDLQYFGGGVGSLSISDQKPIIYLMTYHSAKGLDFDTVIMPFLDEDMLGYTLSRMSKDDSELGDRLLYVATTRARKDLILSCHSTRPLKFVLNLKVRGLVSKISDGRVDNSGTDDEDDEFLY